MTQTRFKGRVWLLTDSNGELIDDIDTDMIFHNAHLAITELDEMGQHAFGNLDGWEHYPTESTRDDIIIAGANFGSGSSRQQAVDCFKALGASCLVTESYGAIYRRNGINSGFPLLIFEELDLTNLNHFDRIEIDLIERTITKDGVVVGRLATISKVQMDILEAGNLFEYAKRNQN